MRAAITAQTHCPETRLFSDCDRAALGIKQLEISTQRMRPARTQHHTGSRDLRSTYLLAYLQATYTHWHEGHAIAGGSLALEDAEQRNEQLEGTVEHAGVQMEVTILHQHFRRQCKVCQYLRARRTIIAGLDPDLLGSAKVRAVMQAELRGGGHVGITIKVRIT